MSDTKEMRDEGGNAEGVAKAAPKSYPSIVAAAGVNHLYIKGAKGFPQFKGPIGIFTIEKGEATACSGSMLIAWPGTKIKANSGSVVIAYEGAEIVKAHKRARIIYIK